MRLGALADSFTLPVCTVAKRTLHEARQVLRGADGWSMLTCERGYAPVARRQFFRHCTRASGETDDEIYSADLENVVPMDRPLCYRTLP